MQVAVERNRGITMADAIGQALNDAMAEDPRVLVMGEDIGRLGGVFRITKGLLDKYGPDRVIDTPLSEAAIVGSAIGMALNGLKPVVEIQFDGFIYPAFNQICCHLARYMTRGKLKELPVVIRIPVGGRFQAAELHAENPETYFVHTPGLRVVALSSVHTARHLLLSAVRGSMPCIVLEPKRLYRTERIDPTTADDTVAMDKARIAMDGTDATVITYGPSVQLAMAASRRLATEGISVRVLDLISLSPIDEEAVLDAVQATGRVLVLTEANRICSVASEVLALIVTKGFRYLRTQPRIVASPHVPPPPAAFQDDYFPSEDDVIREMHALLGQS
jgi:pyruvate dehydrogenase E1 component beta subunit